MKFIPTLLAFLAICGVAMGDTKPILLTSAKLSADLPDYSGFDKADMRSPVALQFNSPNPGAPLDFLYQWTGKQKYAIASTVVLPDFRGWVGVNGVALGGYRLEGNQSIPVFGAGLEYPYESVIDKNFRLVLKVGVGMIFEQNQSLDKGQFRFMIGGGIRF